MTKKKVTKKDENKVKKSNKKVTKKTNKKVAKNNKKTDNDLVKKISISALAIVSFLIVTSIFYGEHNVAREVTMEQMVPAKDIVFKKIDQVFENLAGDQYFCADEKIVFVDIYEEDGERKAKVAVGNNKGQYGMAYLTEVISVGAGEKFADGQSSENSLVISNDEAKVFINTIPIVEDCFRN